MKTRILALLLAAVTALALLPQPARAGDKEIALIGGFIGGLIVGTQLNDHRGPPAVVVHEAGYHRGPRHHDRGGRWEEITVRRWVPAAWEYRYDCGRRVRVYVPAHYAYVRERVWVAYDAPHRGRGPRHW